MGMQGYVEEELVDGQGVSLGITASVRVETRWDAGTRRGKLAECSVCGYAFPVSKMVRYRGKYYCRANKCENDLRTAATVVGQG